MKAGDVARARALGMLMLAGVVPRHAGARETFSIGYSVSIQATDPTRAAVRWDLEGVDEVERVRLVVDPERFSGFEASGTLERRRNEVLWWPNAPYAHLRYNVLVNHRRTPTKGYDSYVGDGWMLTRTSDLFPRSTVHFRAEIEPAPESRARLAFHLPRGWDVASAMPPDGHHRFVVESPGRFDHPRGWLMLGHFRRVEGTTAGTTVTIAAAPGVRLPPERVLAWLEVALPALNGVLETPAPRLLIVTAPDPMWRGGLSGEESFYVHGERPLQTPDRTSPYLHEVFHVVAPFRPAPDAHWVTEGLAEYYSVDLQHRVGQLDATGYAQALDFFARYGVWGEDFTRTPDRRIFNNSAPLVMAALDRRLRAATAGTHGLDDVVRVLAREGGVVSTARFLGVVGRVAGMSFADFFRDHVYRGERPTLPAVEGPPQPRHRRR